MTAQDILIRHFGGYTIREAHGGWIDSGKEYQEYTLVICLSDTTLDKIHAAADEMIEGFRQISVLIQENPTRTEFYSPMNCSEKGETVYEHGSIEKLIRKIQQYTARKIQLSCTGHLLDSGVYNILQIWILKFRKKG